MMLTETFYLNAEAARLWIEVNPETVSLDCNNVQKTPLSIRFWAGEGSDKTALAAFLTLKVESVVGSSVTVLYTYSSSAAVNSYSYTVPSDSYATANRISIYAYEDAARTKEIGSKQVTIVVENPIPFPRSEAWSTILRYKNGEYLLLEDVVYMWASRVPGNTSISPKADLASSKPSGKWKSYQNWPLLATNIALIKFGLIGSAVFKDEYQYSQQGVNAAGAATSDYRKFGTSAFTPNLMLDFLRGIASFKKIQAEGDITATLLYLGVSNNSLSELENGAVRIGPNIGKLPALSPGTCRSIKWIIPMYTRVVVSATLTTENANVRIAPNGVVMNSVLSYSMDSISGDTYDLYGFREPNNNMTYWCLYRIG